MLLIELLASKELTQLLLVVLADDVASALHGRREKTILQGELIRNELDCANLHTEGEKKSG